MGDDHRRLEGLIAPGTWNIDPSAQPQDILSTLIGASATQYAQGGLLDTAKAMNMSPYQILTVGSLVQRESKPDDFAKVARVIYNRLAENRTLEFDSTVNYPLDRIEVATTDGDRAQHTPWNTYVRPGTSGHADLLARTACAGRSRTARAGGLAVLRHDRPAGHHAVHPRLPAAPGEYRTGQTQRCPRLRATRERDSRSHARPRYSGSPIAHSRSPQLHLAAYRALGLDGWTYDRIECTADQLPALVGGFGPEWVGVSVTMPGKFAALRFADERTGRAELVGSANTLVRTPVGVAGRQHRYRRRDRGVGAGVGPGGRARLGRHRARRGRGTRRAWRAGYFGRRAQPRQGRAAAWSSARGSGVEARWIELGHTAAPTSTSWSTPSRPRRWRRTHPLFAATPLLLDAIYDPWPTPLAAAVEAAGGRVDQRPADAAESGLRAGRAVHGEACAQGGDARRAWRALAERTAPMLAAVTSTMATYPVDGEVLTQDQPAREGGDDRRQTGQDREGLRWQAAQRDQLKGVRHDRRHHADGQPEADDLPLHGGGIDDEQRGRCSENRADHRRDRQRVEIGEIRRRPRGRQDVAGPAHRSRGGERQTHRIEVADFDAGEAEQRDTCQREHRPQPGACASAHHHRKCQRAKHFDGHGHAERNPRQRIVKAQVHHRQAGR